jgi:hypothetical protein
MVAMTQNNTPANQRQDQELRLDALLEDASVKLLMERDGVDSQEITELFAKLRAQRIAKRWRNAA